MKLALVSQPFDTILPPHQNSVGACTYGLALSLSEAHEVLVYGSNSTGSLNQKTLNPNFLVRTVPLSTRDRVVLKARKATSTIYDLWTPISTSSLLFPDYGRAVAESLKDEHCDVIHVQHCSQYLPVLRKLNPGAKIVLHLHAELFSQSDFDQIRYRFSHADLITSVSNYVTEKVKSKFPEFAQRCETTYNGIDPAEFAEMKDYRVVNSRPDRQIFYAGGISPHKGLHVLLDAFDLVLQRAPETRLLISGPFGTYPLAETFDRIDDAALIDDLRKFYGSPSARSLFRKLGSQSRTLGSYEQLLRDQISTRFRDRASLLGGIPRPDLIRNYFESDLFVFPPVWNEGFGIPPVEAMAAGTPVVASRSGAVVETIADQQTGYIVDRNKSADLADKINFLLADDGLRERMGRAGKRRALELFSWPKIARRVGERYESLLTDTDTERIQVKSAAS